MRQNKMSSDSSGFKDRLNYTTINNRCSNDESTLDSNQWIQKSQVYYVDKDDSIFGNEPSTNQQSHKTSSTQEYNNGSMMKDQRSHSFCMGFKENLVENNVQASRQLLSKIAYLISVNSTSLILPKLKQLLHEQKNQEKFIESIIQVVKKCAPVHYLDDGKFLLKQVWKFIKKLMENYIGLKKSIIKYQAEQQVVKMIVQYLHVDNSEEVMSKLIQISIEEGIHKRIEQKIKKLFNYDWNLTLNELEKALDVENLATLNSFRAEQKQNLSESNE